MLSKELLDSLTEKLSQLPPSQKLSFLKTELCKIPDPVDRQLAETFFVLILGAAVCGNERNHIVVLIHGIRTRADWQLLVKEELEAAGITVCEIRYGFFDAFRFWFPVLFKTAPIRRVTRELRGIRAKNRNAHISVIAHSFGTYIVSQILKECPDIQLHRLILCGSILPLSYDWDSIPNYPDAGYPCVINEVGVRDYLPVYAETTTWQYGASGRFGFGSHLVIDRFHNLDHSGFFCVEIIKRYWVPFFLEGTIVKTEYLPSRTPYLASILPYGKYVVTIVVVMLYLFGLGKPSYTF